MCMGLCGGDPRNCPMRNRNRMDSVDFIEIPIGIEPMLAITPQGLELVLVLIILRVPVTSFFEDDLFEDLFGMDMSDNPIEMDTAHEGVLVG